MTIISTSASNRCRPPRSPDSEIRGGRKAVGLGVLFEVLEIGGRLSLANRHQQAVGAEQIILLADLHVLIVLHAIVLEPDRIAGPLIASRYRPGARQGV